MPPQPDPDPNPPGTDSPRSPRKAAAKPKAEPIEFDLFSGAAPSPRRATPASGPTVRSTARPQPVATDLPTTPQPSTPAPAAPAPSASSVPLSPSPTPSTPTGTRPMAHSPNLDDFRRNADRQSREQKSFGNVLATITYSILVAFILVTALAGYGGYILFQRIKLQSQSIAELDRRYEAEVVGLKEDQNRAHDEIQRISDDLARQQEQISRLRAVDDKLTSDLASERTASASLKAQLDQLVGVRR